MPAYDYRCRECDEIFEARHSMDCEEPVVCPACGSVDTHKVFLETPGLYIHWWNAKASSEATLPKYLGPVRRRTAPA